MARLIDADALIEEVKTLQVFVNGLRGGKGILNTYAKLYRESLLRIIDEQPTAYSVEKVVAEIKSLSGYEIYKNTFDLIIDIVKKGGR